MARLKVVHRPFLPTSSPFRLPELQRLIEVMRHCMRRVVGIPMSLPGALHTVASQHISTLHNTSGTHILRYVPSQVKHHLFATRFLALRATRFFAHTHVHFGPHRVARTMCRCARVAFCRATHEVSVLHMMRRCNLDKSVAPRSSFHHDDTRGHDRIRHRAAALTTRTPSTSESATGHGRGRVRNARRSCSDLHARERRRPWSYPIFSLPKDLSSPPRPSPT